MAIKELDGEDTLGSLVRYLESRGWPNDRIFVNDLVEYPIYRSAPEYARLMLMVLEEEEGHKEPVDVASLLAQNKIQLEHVMPQTISDDANGDAWKEMLGENWPEVHNSPTRGGGASEHPSMSPSSNPISRPSKSSIRRDVRSGNLRIKKQFTDHEKDRFLDDAFEYIANYFEGSLKELETRNPEIGTRFKRVDSSQFTAAIYVSGSLASSCRIWMDGQGTFGGIAYSASERSYGNSINESLTVDDDSYSLFLKPLFLLMHSHADKQLTYEGGAEYLWSHLMRPLQTP